MANESGTQLKGIFSKKDLMREKSQNSIKEHPYNYIARSKIGS